MKAPIRHAVMAAMAVLLALSAGAAAAGATVTFVQPQRFSDIPFSNADRERVLADLSGHFNKLAAKLPTGQQLTVEVLDIDLAGDTWPTHMAQDLRILTGRADWPRMQLRYTISDAGRVVRSGEEHISDMSYLHQANRIDRQDSLRYEKKMLDDWFKERIAAR